MKNFFKEFSDFLNQGNIVEIAVGLLLATAFKDIVTTFSDGFIMPFVNKFLGSVQGSDSYFMLFDMKFEYGGFISAMISFIIVGVVLFVIVKAYNKTKKAAVEETGDTELSLLKEIRDSLNEKK